MKSMSKPLITPGINNSINVSTLFGKHSKTRNSYNESKYKEML